MKETTLQTSLFDHSLAINDLGEAPSQEAIRVVDQFFYGIGVVATVILGLSIYLNG